MKRAILLSALALLLADCGIERPLMKPKDIPAFEEKQRRKRAHIEGTDTPAEETNPQWVAPGIPE